jgi:hypothetical protein
MEKYAGLIQAHYASVWPTSAKELRWSAGPVDELPRDFCVLAIERSSEMRAYATRCMSAPGQTDALELHLLVRPQDGKSQESALVELLTAVAHYHHTKTRLGLGHTVNFGRPFVTGSRCTQGFISLPYLDGPQLEWMDVPKVRFLWLIPITPSELEFKKRNSADALEERLEAARFNYLDPYRMPVV